VAIVARLIFSLLLHLPRCLDRCRTDLPGLVGRPFSAVRFLGIASCEFLGPAVSRLSASVVPVLVVSFSDGTLRPAKGLPPCHVAPQSAVSCLTRLGTIRTASLRCQGLPPLRGFLSLHISFLSSPDFLWTHRLGNSSPFRPTRPLLCRFRPRHIGFPPTMPPLASDSTPPRFLSCPKENRAERGR
jgi:hypothetical protein